MRDLLETLLSIGGASVQQGVPMERHTTWRVGGPAEYYFTARRSEAVRGLLRSVKDAGGPLTVIGNGSNLLVSDAGLEGVALRLAGDFTSVSVVADSVEAGAGAMLGTAVEEAAFRGLGGLEFAAGIPGTVGGAVLTNAGAFNCSFADVVAWVDTMTRDGEARRYERFDAGYRSPLVPADEIVLSAGLRLRQSEREEVEGRIREVIKRRRETQPWGVATAGSVFKNPTGDSAGRMIEACGLKGTKYGGARISEAHANFIVNGGEATAADIKRLIDLARESVLERFGVELGLEVRLIGFEGE